MEQLKFRNLTKDEIEVRVGGGKNLLLYKTARTDAKLLDETVGQLNWQKKFYQVKNTMICSIGINVNYNDPSKEPLFIWKDDAGDDDYTMEKIKAEASDSFKRAGFAWGIGRNLYTAPRIKLEDKFKDKQFFDLESIGYDENGNINELVISTDFGKTIVFSYKNGRKVSQNADLTPKTTINEEPKGFTKQDEELISKFQDFNTAPNTIDLHDRTVIESYLNTCEKESQDKFYDYIAKHYGTMTVSKLSELQGKDLVSMIKNRK